MTTAQKQAGLPKPEVALHGETKALVLQVPDKPITIKIDSGVPDWVSPSIQVFVAIIAATVSVIVILLQMRKQRELTLKQQIETTKAELRLDAYREFQKLYAELNASQRVAVEIRSMFIALQQNAKGMQESIPVTPIQYREPTFRTSLNKLTNNVVQLIFFLERHAPLLPGFEIFKLAFGTALSEMNNGYAKLQPVLLKWLPIDNPNYGSQPNAPQFIHCPTITTNAVSEFSNAMESMLKPIGLFECWASDFSIDLQNHLLGEYADQHVLHREPIDPDFFVVTSEPKQRDSLTKYFMEKTEYGRNWSAAQDWARQEQLRKVN